MKAQKKAAAKAGEFVKSTTKDKDAFCVILEGDSMEPEFKAGDRVVFEPNRKAKNGDAVLLKLKDGRTLFKWYAGDDGSEHVFASENQDKYGPFSVPKAEVEFIYPARELKREIKSGASWFNCKLPSPLVKQFKDSAKILGIPVEQFTLEVFKRALPEIQARLGKKATA